jgi:hypothetical protein
MLLGDVAVEDAAVRIVQRACNLDADVERLSHRQALTLGQHFAERPAVEQLHGDIRPVFDLADVEYRYDVGMREHAGGPCLAQKARPVLVVAAQLGMQELDNQRTVDARVIRLVDGGHRPLAQFLEDLIAADMANGCCASRRCDSD